MGNNIAIPNAVPLTGGTMTGDLEFSGTAALEVADNAYAFKSKTDNDAGIVFNATDVSVDLMSTTGVANAKVFVETGISRKAGKRVTSDFTKTADTTIAAVTGLAIPLLASTTYMFKAVLFITADATGGSKFRIGNLNSLTATNIIYEATLLDDATSAYVVTTRGTALDTDFSDATSIAGVAVIEGVIEVNAAGTMGVGFAQSVANGSSSVLRGSYMIIEEMA